MAHILIVEDDRDNREMAGVILRAAGHAVSSAGDALHGIRMALQGQPDLILMDLALPRVDGWVATRLLQGHAATQHIPIVAFTAHTTAEALARARAVGCAAIIAKPFELDQFLNRIASVLRQQRRKYRERRALGTSGARSYAARRET